MINVLSTGLPDHGWCPREVCRGKSNRAPPHVFLDVRKGLYNRWRVLLVIVVWLAGPIVAPPPLRLDSVHHAALPSVLASDGGEIKVGCAALQWNA